MHGQNWMAGSKVITV